jgi:hypothetical protein
MAAASYLPDSGFKTFKPFNRFAPFNSPHLYPPPRPRGRIEKGLEPLEQLEPINFG